MRSADVMLNFESGKPTEELKTVAVEQVSIQHLRITGALVSFQNNNGNQVAWVSSSYEGLD